MLKTDTLAFSTLGYAPRTYHLKIADRNKGELTTAILMDPVSYELDAVTVRGLTLEAFKREFLALQLPDDNISSSAFVDVNDLGITAPDLTPGFSPGISLSPTALLQIGRASCRERECPYVLFSVVAVSIKKTS